MTVPTRGRSPGAEPGQNNVGKCTNCHCRHRTGEYCASCGGIPNCRGNAALAATACPMNRTGQLCLPKSRSPRQSVLATGDVKAPRGQGVPAKKSICAPTLLPTCDLNLLRGRFLCARSKNAGGLNECHELGVPGSSRSVGKWIAGGSRNASGRCTARPTRVGDSRPVQAARRS
jgi:hypothetical protein